MTAGRNARVLVTGSRGRIARRLRARTDESTDWRWASSRPEHPGEIWLDPTSRESWAEALGRERPDVVVHLAAAIPGSATPIEAALASTADAVAQLISAASSSGVRRVVLASSAAVYGDSTAEPRRETDAPTPRGEYGRAKAESEELLTAAVGRGVIPEAVILRPFNVFGAPMTDSLISKLLRSEQGAPVILHGWDDFVRDYVHVEEVAEAFEVAAGHDLDGPLLIANVGRGIPVSNRALVAELALARDDPLHYQVTEGEPSVSVADVSVLASTLGLRPQRGPAFGLT